MTAWGTVAAMLWMLLGAALSVAAEEDEGAARRYAVLPLPTLDYGPETGFGAGAVVLVTGRPFPDTRQSTLEVEGGLTTERQRILELDMQLFLPEDRALLTLSAEVLRYPEDFWGVGPDTPAAAEERYTADRIELQVEPLVRPVGDLFVGPSAQAQWVYGLEAAPGGLLASGEVPGSDGGRSVGLGYVALWEGRQRPVTPAPGERYLGLRQQWYRPALGSDHRFSRLSLDGRAYLPAGPGLVALQGLALLHGGAPPFRMMALLGGDQIMRGYYLGRYRDKHLLAAQAELRMPVWWRIGAVAFVSIGDVTDQLSALTVAALKPAAGGGLRIRLDDDEGTNLRLDAAAGRDAFGFYFSFGEAF